MSTTETLTKPQDETAAGFHQSWFPVALASEVGPGQVVGREGKTRKRVKFGLSLGAFCTPLANLVLGASARLSTRLKASSVDTSVWVHLPVELAAGVFYEPVQELIDSSTVRYSR